MPTTIPVITLDDHPRFKEASAKMGKLHARLVEIEQRLQAITRETESGRAEAAEAELDAVLRDDAGRADPKVKKLHEQLKRLEDEAEALTRTEAVLRVASSEQHKIILALRTEARRPAVAAALERWAELLDELDAFAPQADVANQAFVAAVQAQGRMVTREDTTWCLTAQERARLRQRTEALVAVLRGAGYTV